MTDLFVNFNGACTIDDWLQEAVVEESTRVANVDGSLNLVTSEYPELDTSLSDHFNSFGDTILKLVFKCGRSN